MSKYIYKVVLTYQNIESGGSTRYTAEYNLEADNYCDAIVKADKKLGYNRDGKLYSVYVEETMIDE